MHFNKIKFLTFLSKNIQFDSIKDCFIFQTEFLKKKIYQKLMLTYCLYAVVQVYTMYAVSPQLSNILRNFGYLQYNTHTHTSLSSHRIKLMWYSDDVTRIALVHTSRYLLQFTHQLSTNYNFMAHDRAI